jgi:uncharacterized integral membrane protein (TIGR00697 family)
MKISYRLVIIITFFITCLITANIIAVKVINLGPLVLPAAIFVFPLSYICGDVLTEVYGYRVARKVIWFGFICNLVFVFFAWVGQVLPGDTSWEAQAAYERILGFVPRIVGASICGYLVGEFVNSYVLARMKILTRGRWLWSRTIGSTLIGQALDTSIFITLAYINTGAPVPTMIFHHWSAKVVIEAICTPATYAIVNWLKRRENVDTYDYKTRYSPFMIFDKEQSP